MKNTTNQESSYAAMPSLRVAFKNDEIVEEKVSLTSKTKKQGEQSNVQPSKNSLPQFDDYRRKAKDHDPL